MKTKKVNVGSFGDNDRVITQQQSYYDSFAVEGVIIFASFSKLPYVLVVQEEVRQFGRNEEDNKEDDDHDERQRDAVGGLLATLSHRSPDRPVHLVGRFLSWN